MDAAQARLQIESSPQASPYEPSKLTFPHQDIRGTRKQQAHHRPSSSSKKSSSKATILQDVRKPSIFQPGGVSVPSSAAKLQHDAHYYGLLFTSVSCADTEVSLSDSRKKRTHLDPDQKGRSLGFKKMKTPDPVQLNTSIGEKALRSISVICSILYYC